MTLNFILSLPLLTHLILMFYQIWLEKSREQKLDYDMKSFNANKAQNGENGNGKYTHEIIFNHLTYNVVIE